MFLSLINLQRFQQASLYRSADHRFMIFSIILSILFGAAQADPQNKQIEYFVDAAITASTLTEQISELGFNTRSTPSNELSETFSVFCRTVGSHHGTQCFRLCSKDMHWLQMDRCISKPASSSILHF